MPRSPEHIWVSTQPMEEAEEPEHLLDVMNWVGMDRIMFSTDYPHWDFDDPWLALPLKLDENTRAKIFSENARALWDAVIELRWVSGDAMEEAWRSPAGRTATDDLVQFADLERTSWSIVERRVRR